MKSTGVKRSFYRVFSLAMSVVLLCGLLASLAITPAQAASVSDLQNQLAALQKEEEALKSQLSSYKNDAAKQQEYSDSLKQKIQNSTEQIEILQQQIELCDTQISEKDAQIQAREVEISEKETAISEQYVLLGERLRVIAQSGNLSTLQMIFDTDSYVDYLLKSKVTARIAANDQKLMDEMNEQIEALNREKELLQQEIVKIDEERVQVQELKAAADEKKAELDELYAESNAVLKKLQASVNSVNSQLAQKKKEEEALDKQIKELLSGTTTTGKYTGGTMTWPVPAVHNISSGYGYRWGTLHRGVDIANGSVPIYGQNIVAAADGTVIYANKSGWGGGYGLFVMVNHGYDSAGRQIVTLYAHMSAVLVNVGDKVTAGSSLIGRAGNTGDVTGPHLHFEVRVNGTAVDPIANGYLKVN